MRGSQAKGARASSILPKIKRTLILCGYIWDRKGICILGSGLFGVLGVGLRANQARDGLFSGGFREGSRVCFVGCGRLFWFHGIMVNDVPLSDSMRCCDHMQAKNSVSSDVHVYFT